MDRRTLAAVIAVVVLAVLFVLAAAPHVPLRARQGVSPFGFALQAGIVVLAALAALLVVAHQYVRWRPYRPAIHLAAAAIAFVVALFWWLGPDGLVGDDPLSGRERGAIRVAGVGLLLYLVFFLARFLDGGDGGR